MKAIVFPGQGSQYVGMGKEFYDNFKEVKQVFEEVDDALNFKLSKLILEGPKQDLDLTENTQPAIMTVGVAIYKVLIKEKIKNLNQFKFFAGHSLGEYTALICADSLNLREGAKLLKARGKFMQEAVPINIGAMAAVLGVELSFLNEILSKNNNNEISQISNDNCPGQIVISGHKNKINEILKILKEDHKKKAVLLPVSAPFHCSLMQPAADRMKDLFKNIVFKKPQTDIISNVTAKLVEDCSLISDLLFKQITSTVRWRESIDFMVQNGVQEFLEIGPGKALSGMIKRISVDLKISSIDNISQLNEFN
jgi:[acyl-carrier-protein] S-malonyltransferase